MAAKPQEWINWRGRSASNNWMIQLWCTPTSLATIAFSGSARDSARIRRSGRSGIWSDAARPLWYLCQTSRPWCSRSSQVARCRRRRAGRGPDVPFRNARLARAHAEDRKFRRIVAAEFRRIDVDLNQPGRWNRQRVAIEPGAGRAIVEGEAQGQDDIGMLRRVVRRIGAVAADRTKRQTRAAR